ncbi:MAG: thioredoxin family protein [Bacteroidia bacterium]
MNKNSILFLIAFIFISSSFRVEKEIKWMGFNEGYTLAKKKKKLMLVDVYTDWCGWCKRMDRDAYGQAEVIDLVSGNFIAIKFNPEVNAQYNFEGKLYNGRELAGVLSENRLNGYPTTIFVQPVTAAKKMVVGYRNAEQMKAELVSAKSELSGKK